MCARERLPVECLDVHEGGVGRAIRGTAVVARERLSVGRGNVRVRGFERAS